MKHCLFFVLFLISIVASAQTIDQVKKFKSSAPANPQKSNPPSQAEPQAQPTGQMANEEDHMAELRKMRGDPNHEAELINQMLKQGQEKSPAQDAAQTFNFLLNPKVQKFARFLSDKKIVAALNSFSNKDNMSKMFKGQILLMLAFFIIRAWLSPKTKTFTAGLVANFWVTGLYLFISLLLLPKLIYGPSYFDFVKAAIAFSKEIIG